MAKGVAKKVKDPNAPKRALTAYFIWLQENREAIKKPGMTATQVAKAAGAAWRELTDKTKWEKKAEDDKKRYDREIAAYKAH
uniref:HMG box domain-containing protein n=1 Tax=Panagrellus redivivus TaxID=6233 RepID=A0A7E5A160_PANRE